MKCRLLKKAEFDLYQNAFDEPRSQSNIEQMITSDIPSSSVNQGQINIMQNNLQNLANEGRQVLKIMDDYKFKLIQSLNIFKSDDVRAKLEQKQKILAQSASLVYSIVFDLENFDLTPIYEEEQFSANTTEKPTFNDNDFNNEEDADINDTELDNIETDEEESSDEENSSEDEEPQMQGGFDEEMSEEEGEEENE